MDDTVSPPDSLITRALKELQGVQRRIVDAPDAGGTNEGEPHGGFALGMLAMIGDLYGEVIASLWAARGHITGEDVPNVRRDVQRELYTHLGDVAATIMAEMERRRP